MTGPQRKHRKGRLARVRCARERVRQTPCRFRVTLFSSSESPREQKGIGIRRRTLRCRSVGMQFPESIGNTPREIRQSRLKTGKQPKHPEVCQSKLTCLVNTIILALSGFGIKHYSNYRFDVGYFISLQKLPHRKQYLITLNTACR